uniref:Multifunctional methyltransferase subunit TRM112-like protein n=1 Tax=Craspedostauros australis TaxID=1486917 RepID=A0A7R9WN83_9STRA|mmetsp:Transcript_13044/g.35990  ORF Transcript_13044/g.35990 Transcript_13044/m.35990 type:complete len:157 (+) Transcript_13044:166-636(+)|eukprot:CAMPEP_0198129148 /NCGR_PEP_ID=MMETSP1442-20131203/51043_1 /TAXON_ID= /ORGANISM="Craspedostauros australis, Strain CCMP3328" /LENGTH=156 /DNA_ID=CAMNT_0043789479 /DNA_START=112 /DNA_END=582 /DNA_ORIENTATION=+
MRLLTHNFLQSNVKGTTKGYPLRIEAKEVVIEDSPVDAELLVKMISRMKYDALVQAYDQVITTAAAATAAADTAKNDGDSSKTSAEQIKQLAPAASMPKEPPTQETLQNDATIQKILYDALFNVHVITGQLICPDTGRKFPIKQGIPNMILHEDEL